MPLICPTCQIALSNAGGRLLFCMGLFSIFGSAHLPRRVLQCHPQLCLQRHGAMHMVAGSSCMADLHMNIPRGV
jgi:hypothetical protein